MEEFKTGIELIAEERQRQIEKEGWSISHDAHHDKCELALAAAVYATPVNYREFKTETINVYDEKVAEIPSMWPFEDSWYKPSPENRVKELVKAGALIAAEIDRLKALGK